MGPISGTLSLVQVGFLLIQNNLLHSILYMFFPLTEDGSVPGFEITDLVRLLFYLLFSEATRDLFTQMNLVMHLSAHLA